MKRFDSSDFNYEKNKEKQWHKEHRAGGFRCAHCKQLVVISEFMGTVNRNHCNLCLWSKHVDEHKGDRRADCQAGMRPIGLAFKQEGYSRQGELMLIHACLGCSKTSINRLASDDLAYKVDALFKESLALDVRKKAGLEEVGIHVLNMADAQEIHLQLYGKSQ